MGTTDFLYIKCKCTRLPASRASNNMCGQEVETPFMVSCIMNGVHQVKPSIEIERPPVKQRHERSLYSVSI